MLNIVSVVVMLAGLGLLFAGAALSEYGVAVLGAGFGAIGGYFTSSTIGGVLGLSGYVAIGVAVAVGLLVGIIVAHMVLSLAVAAVSFIVGAYFGILVAPALVGGPGLLAPVVALLTGMVAAVIGTFLTKTMMVLFTSFVGAAVVSRSVTVADLMAARTELAVDPLVFDLAAPLFVGLFVLGVLSQFGLFRFGYVTRLVSMLPGASLFRNRGPKTQ